MTPERLPRAGNRRFQGFTLLELLLALVVVGTLTALALAAYSSYMEQAKVSRAEADLAAIEGRIALYEANQRTLPTSLSQLGEGNLLDPWGHAYYYLNFTGLQSQALMRKDRNLVPINSDYDLYSAGADGATRPPLLAPVSQDDIIRANNGGYVGVASAY